MSSIGDIILTSPVVRQLRAKYPTAQIDYVIRDNFSTVMAANPDISNLRIIDVRNRTALKALKQQIRETKYDVILDLHRNFRSAYLCRFWGRPPVYKIRKHKLLRFLLVNFKINRYAQVYGKVHSVAEKYLRAAAPLSVNVNDTRLSLHLSENDRKQGKRIWDELEKDQFAVVMAPGAQHFTKRWPPAYYAELIQKLYSEKGMRTVLVGGPNEVQLIEEIQKIAGENLTRSFAGEVSLPVTFALISHAKLFISNDSGLMHAAAALNVPQISFFGSTARELGFFPINPRAIVLENTLLSCRPCTHIGRNTCPKSHFKCMKEISPNIALKNILIILKK